jgi:hypothetical protein
MCCTGCSLRQGEQNLAWSGPERATSSPCLGALSASWTLSFCVSIHYRYLGRLAKRSGPWPASIRLAVSGGAPTQWRPGARPLWWPPMRLPKIQRDGRGMPNVPCRWSGSKGTSSPWKRAVKEECGSTLRGAIIQRGRFPGHLPRTDAENSPWDDCRPPGGGHRGSSLPRRTSCRTGRPNRRGSGYARRPAFDAFLNRGRLREGRTTPTATRPPG